MVVGFALQPLPDVPSIEEVVHDPDRVIAQFLGQRAKIQYLLGVLDAPIVGYGDAEFHAASRLSFNQTMNRYRRLAPKRRKS